MPVFDETFLFVLPIMTEQKVCPKKLGAPWLNSDKELNHLSTVS